MYGWILFSLLFNFFDVRMVVYIDKMCIGEKKIIVIFLS